MKEKAGENTVVLWYDAVIGSSGALQWQNELNALNKYIGRLTKSAEYHKFLF